MIAAAELLCWSAFGLVLGFFGHWWKAHADPTPDVLDKDRPFMNMALTEYSFENYALDHRYDDVGYWDYLSLRNLFYYLITGAVGLPLCVYATAEGYAAAHASLCKGAGLLGFVPVFCP